LPFTNLLQAEVVQRVLVETGTGWRNIVYTPAVTLAAFLSQMLCADGSCAAAVARIRAWLVAQGQPACSAATGAYTKARQRLKEDVLSRLLRYTGRELERQTPDAWRWHGRPVKVVDGTTASLPDTPALRAAYPAVRAVVGGSFPIVRIVGLFALASGAALDVALGPWRGRQSGETALFRRLLEALSAGDIVLGDRIYSGFHDIAGLLGRGIDFVFRKNARRRSDFRRSRRLGRHDHLVRYVKPCRRPWLSLDEHRALPEQFVLREVRVLVPVRGFRTQVLTVVTSLLDPIAYPAAEIARLFRQRWQIELDFRALKVTLHMDVLRCQTPAGIRKEIYAHLLAYNLLCGIRAQAASVYGLVPRDLSFTATLQSWRAFTESLAGATRRTYILTQTALLDGILAHRVGQRPDRFEPRARKRRPKDYPLLRLTRDQARKALQCRRCA